MRNRLEFETEYVKFDACPAWRALKTTFPAGPKGHDLRLRRQARLKGSLVQVSERTLSCAERSKVPTGTSKEHTHLAHV